MYGELRYHPLNFKDKMLHSSCCRIGYILLPNMVKLIISKREVFKMHIITSFGGHFANRIWGRLLFILLWCCVDAGRLHGATQRREDPRTGSAPHGPPWREFPRSARGGHDETCAQARHAGKSLILSPCWGCLGPSTRCMSMYYVVGGNEL